MKNEIFQIRMTVGSNHPSFTVREGEGLSIVGESSCGKSELLALLSRHGKGVAYRGNKSKLSKDEENLFNVEIGYFDGTANSSKEDKIIDVLEKASVKFNMLPSEIGEIFDIEEGEYDQKVKKTKGVLNSSVGLLDKLCEDYKLLLIDDAFGLDFDYKKRVVPFLKSVSDKFSLTYIIATSDPYMAAALTSYALLLESRKPVEYGKCDSVLKKPLHPYAKWFVASSKLKKDASFAFVRTAKDSKPSKKACRFSSICPIADEKCRLSQPEFSVHGKGHVTACHKI